MSAGHRVCKSSPSGLSVLASCQHHLILTTVGRTEPVTSLLLHAEHFHEEGPLVGGLFDYLGQRGPGTVAGAGFDADEHGGAILGLTLLEARGELKAMRGDDAVIVICGSDQGGG